MAQLFSILALITQLLPLVLQTVKTVEEMFPAGGQGAQKLAIVQGIVEHAISVSTDLQVTTAQVTPVLAPIVTGMVNLLNATGAFKKT